MSLRRDEGFQKIRMYLSQGSSQSVSGMQVQGTGGVRRRTQALWNQEYLALYSKHATMMLTGPLDTSLGALYSSTAGVRNAQCSSDSKKLKALGSSPHDGMLRNMTGPTTGMTLLKL